MIELPAWAAPAAGVATGFLAGYVVRRSRLCSFGAIEDALIGRDWRRMKIFGLALAIAILATQLMVLAGWLDPSKSTFLPTRLPILSVVMGSLLFGIGMSFVGTCAFGSLIRMGGGDIRSFVVILVFSIAAFAVLRGALAPFRIGFLEQYFWGGPGGGQISLVALGDWLTGHNLRLALTIVIAALLTGFVVFDRRLVRAPRLLLAAVCLGLGVAAGWFFTGVAIDAFADNPPRMQSLTFVAPTAKAVLMVTAPERGVIDFGVGSVFGVALGAFAHAIAAKEFRWEAFDDQYEMRRHIGGAVCMGVGGILAGGCTIGQGLSAGSMLSLSWPVAVLGMILGARFGLAVMIEGSVKDWVKSRSFR